MKTSFIIPAYNEEGYIEDCLKSIYNLEGLENFEVIVVDNNSTDKTAEIVGKFFPLAKLLRESKKGPTWARKKGFEESHGNLLVFLDADARVPKDYYKKLIHHYNSDSTLAGLSGPYKFYDAGAKGKLFELFANQFFFPVTQFILDKVFNKGTWFFGGGFSAKCSAIQEIGGFNTKIKFYGDDADMGRRLRTVGEVRFLDTMFVYNSIRRLKKEGYIRSGLTYAINFIWTIFFKAPLTSSYTDIR